MADRLQELLQQRALIKEHLAWLEGEISAAAGRPMEIGEPLPPTRAVPEKRAPLAAAPLPVPMARAGIPLPAAPVSRPVPDETDALIAQLATEEEKRSVPDKKGCWIFFCLLIAAAGLLFLGSVYYFYRG